MIKHLTIPVSGQGLHPFTAEVREVIASSGQREGLCTLFIRHTSASLLIQENYDDSARIDLAQPTGARKRPSVHTHPGRC